MFCPVKYTYSLPYIIKHTYKITKSPHLQNRPCSFPALAEIKLQYTVRNLLNLLYQRRQVIGKKVYQ